MNWLHFVPQFRWLRSKFDKKNELLAGVMGAFLLIPQAILFAELAGVPPEYGIFSGIFITFVCALFGNSIMASGPTTATSILIGLSVMPLAGRGGDLYIHYVLILSFMVGLVQLFVWLVNGSKIFSNIAPSVLSGVMHGVGFLIMMSSLDGMLGLAPIKVNFFYEKIFVVFTSFGELVNPYAMAIGITTVFIGFMSHAFFPKFYILVMIVFGTIAALVVDGIYTPTVTHIEYLGRISLSNFSLEMPAFKSEHLPDILKLIPSAVTVAFMGLAQTILIAKQLQVKVDSSLNIRKEVFAIGMANIVGSLCAGFAGSGSFNRTQVNQEMNARTPLAMMISAVVLAVIVFLFGGLFIYFPMSAISAVLFIVGFRMIKIKVVKSFCQNRMDTLMFFCVLLTTMFLGIEYAVFFCIIQSLFYKQCGQVLKVIED